MLGASAKGWSSGRKILGDLEEKENSCVSTLLTETRGSSCYQKTTLESKQLLPTSSQLQKVIADCYTSGEYSWFKAPTGPPQGAEGGSCPRASIRQAMASSCHGPRCRASVPPPSAHEPASPGLIFAFAFDFRRLC